MISFQDYNGDLKTIIRSEITGRSDLIIEGGSNFNTDPIVISREAGYTGPYIRVDLGPRFPTTLDDSSDLSKPISDEYGRCWNVRGNCYNPVLIRRLIERFKSKDPVFLTYCALAGATLDEELDFMDGCKNKEDIVSPEEAVEILTRNYKIQLHYRPVGFTIMSESFAEQNKKTIESKPFINPLPNLIVLNDWQLPSITEHVVYVHFRTFLERSIELGWELFLSSLEPDVLLMKLP